MSFFKTYFFLNPIQWAICSFDMGGGGSADPQVGAAALAQAELSKEQLAWVKEVYGEQAPDRAQSIADARRIGGLQEVAMGQQNDLTAKYATQQGKQFDYEDQIRADAQAYDTPARQAAAASKASADVEGAFDRAQTDNQRGMSRAGVNISSGRALAMNNQMGIQKAVALAGAQNNARNTVETQGYARKMDSANLGRSLASNQATSASTAASLGNSASANSMNVGAVNGQGNALMNSGFAGASNSMASAGNLYAQNAQIENQASSSGNGMMSLLGGAAMKFAMSDVNQKEQIDPLKPGEALDKVAAIPVSDWQYKGDSPADDGGERHTGPMAQDVQRVVGEAAAPGGKAIDLISLNGLNMAATQDLLKKENQLEGQVRQLAVGGIQRKHHG